MLCRHRRIALSQLSPLAANQVFQRPSTPSRLLLRPQPRRLRLQGLQQLLQLRSALLPRLSVSLLDLLQLPSQQPVLQQLVSLQL